MKSIASLGAFWMPFTPNVGSTREHVDPMVERMRAAIVQTQGATP